MEHNKYSQMTDQELLDEKKKSWNLIVTRLVLIGLLIVVAIIISLKKGIGFFTFSPLFFVLPLLRNLKIEDNLKNEILTRNL